MARSRLVLGLLAACLILNACGGSAVSPTGTASTPGTAADGGTAEAADAAAGRPGIAKAGLPTARDDKLPAFRDCGEFVAHMRALMLPRLTRDGRLRFDEEPYRGFRYASDISAPVQGPAARAPLPSEDPRPGVVTDGRLLILATATDIAVVDVSTDRPEVLSRLTLPTEGYLGTRLVLAGDRLLVVQDSDTEDYPYTSLGPMPPFDPTSQLTLVDLRDPAQPKVLAHESVTAHVVAMRRTGGVVRIALTSPLRRLLPDDVDTPAGVRAVPAAGWLPHRQIRDGAGRTVSAGPLVPCDRLRRPGAYSGHDVLTVMSVDMARDDALTAAGTSAVLTGGDRVAMSDDRLFVASTPRRGKAETLVQAFAWTSTDAGYLATGRMPGYVSGPGPGYDVMSARGTTLRVVTSRMPPWRGSHDRHDSGDGIGVTVLTERNGRPTVAGSVAGLAQGREPKVVRWFDDLVVIAPQPAKLPGWIPNAQAGPVDLVSLADPSRPVRIGVLTHAQPTAELLPVGDSLLVGSGVRIEPRHQEDCCTEFISVSTSAARGPRQVDAVSFGRGQFHPTVWLPGRRLLVGPGAARFEAGCPPGARCALGKPPCPATTDVQGALVAVRVEIDGTLDPTCSLVADREVSLVLAVRDRLVAIGNDITMVDPVGLRPLGRTKLRPTR